MTRLLLLLAGLLAASSARAQGPSSYMGVDELSRGMTGVGRTVFHGTRIDTFQVEILGVLRNVFGPQSDIILARLSGDMLEKTNGIAGMSGSPVYIDGRMVGAVAYGWSYSKEPIMGITPIGEMMKILDRPGPDTPSEARFGEGPRLRDEPPSLAGAEAFGPGDLRPVATPLSTSGFAPEVVQDLRDRLLPMGLMPVQGGGGVDPSLPEGPLEPGAALGVQLVRGDLSMTAIGTLTWVDGDRLLGFGHPMLFSGSTTLPMTSAFIHEVVPSQVQSFKLGTASRQIGAITQDRAPGIGGVLGHDVDMVPTTIEVRSSGRQQTYRVEVLRDRSFGPLLTQSAVVSALLTSEKAMGETTVRTRTSVRVKGLPEPIEVANIYAGIRGLGEGVLGVTRPLQLLVQNPYERVIIESARFDLDVAEKVRAAQIEGVRLDRDRFLPGDPVGVTVLLQPFLGEPAKVETTLRIPSRVEDGRLTLVVSSARDHASSDAKRSPGDYAYESLEHLVRRLGEADRNDELIIELLSQKPGVTVSGREVSALPPSVLSALQLGRTSGSIRPVAQSVIERRKVATEFVLSGSQTLFLRVGTDGPGLQFGPGTSGRTGPDDKK